MKAFLTIIFFALLVSVNAQKANPQYNPLKHRADTARGIRDTLKAKYTDTVFVGEFYCFNCSQPIYDVYQIFNKSRKKWTYYIIKINARDIPAPEQFFYTVQDSTIVDTLKAVRQRIKIKP